MNILALETATEACSAALWLQDAPNSCLQRYQYAPREHNHLILPMIESLLAEAGMVMTQFDAIAFGCGPGSFTGVRMAAGVAQGLAYGADLPVIPVSTLAALAQQACDENHHDLAYPCIDARMGEVYWATYRRDASGHVQCVGEEQVIVASQVELPAGNENHGWGIGSGYATYAQPLSERLGTRLLGTLPDCFPTARFIAQLAAHTPECRLPPEQALPVYLRDNVARKPGS